MSILNRRTLLRGATAAAATFACTVPLIAHAAPAQGCCAFCNIARLGNAASEGGFSSIVDLGLTRTTGDAETDRFLTLALARLSRSFDVSPDFEFFNDSRAPNAYAMRAGNIVLMGKRLFSGYMAKNPDGMIVIGLLAHEFGHIVQYQNGGLHDDLSRLAPSVMPVELHADFLAGFYLAQRKAEHPQIDLQAVGAAFDNLGDTDLQSPGHHGTNAQRIAAVTAGYDFGKGGSRRIREATDAGFKYVQRAM